MTNHWCYGTRGHLILILWIFLRICQWPVLVTSLPRDFTDRMHGSLQQWRISLDSRRRVCGKKLNIVPMCTVSPVVHTANNSIYYCECGSPSVPVTAFSWMLSVSTQTLNAALYRSIYSLLTWSSVCTLQGFLVCYCECGIPSVPVTAVSWMLSVSTQTLHAALCSSIYILLTWSSLGILQGIFVSYR